MITVAIDPGKHGCGVAVFRATSLADIAQDNKHLLTAAYAPELPLSADHGLLLAARAVEVYLRDTFGPLEAILRITIERPKVYPTAQQKGDQEDITELSVVVGALLGLLSRHCRDIRLVYPHEWKGQTPKEVTKRQVIDTLTVEEANRIVFPKQRGLHHNIWDAIALGLWAQERFQG